MTLADRILPNRAGLELPAFRRIVIRTEFKSPPQSLGCQLSTVCLSCLAAWCNTCTRVPPPEQHPQTLGRAYVSRAAGATPAPGILRLNSIRN
ncbi:hypothetical protein, partial [Chamaesiphon sp.]|uniref:hypothetical protein n=1 Tax=Chamaesiphon sp. TaxID=2814140 RepID=UPI0035940C67